MLSFEESGFWFDLGITTLSHLHKLGDLASFSLLVLLAFGVGSVLIEFMPRKLDWTALIGEALSSKNPQLISVVLSDKARADLFVGLGRAFGAFCFLGVYNAVLFVFHVFSNVEVQHQSSIVQLIFAIFFGGFVARGLPKYADGTFENTRRMVKIFRAAVDGKECDAPSDQIDGQ